PIVRLETSSLYNADPAMTVQYLSAGNSAIAARWNQYENSDYEHQLVMNFVGQGTGAHIPNLIMYTNTDTGGTSTEYFVDSSQFDPSVTITQYGSVGEAVEGTYRVRVCVAGGCGTGSVIISGSFRMERISDG
ncbi:MAG: hypothetical protein OEX00_08425, partial [Gammaproteobacteria bacterium]|nr:hypothetical protein [Gammaproteobacteria bacterium]